MPEYVNITNDSTHHEQRNRMLGRNSQRQHLRYRPSNLQVIIIIMLYDKKRRPKRQHYQALLNLIPLNSTTLYNGKETTS